MFAIRSKSPAFRRSGVTFKENTWTLVEQPTPEQLAEPMLISLEVEDGNDPRLFGREVVRHEPAPVAHSEAEAEAPVPQPWQEEIARQNTRIAELEAENAALQAQIEAQNAKGGKKNKPAEANAAEPTATAPETETGSSEAQN